MGYTPPPVGWAEKEKSGIIICAQADYVDIHKTEHYPTLGFCLKFKVKWAFAKIFFSHLPYELLHFIYNLLVQNREFHKNHKKSFFPFKLNNVNSFR